VTAADHDRLSICTSKLYLPASFSWWSGFILCAFFTKKNCGPKYHCRPPYL